MTKPSQTTPHFTSMCVHAPSGQCGHFLSCLISYTAHPSNHLHLCNTHLEDVLNSPIFTQHC
uniref:Putative ovule protein n=1 Tax=Solanum chacoense TaxID=4108 RepID=A0A0V0GQP9_SOLCH